MQDSFTSVNKAFSKQSVYYDAYDIQNETLQWMRKIVRDHVNRYMKKGCKVLELNAGTGLDATYFIDHNDATVLATDLTDGMIAEIRRKISNRNDGKLSVKQCSYTDLNQIEERSFGYVFSNFGGLNCVDDLKKVTKHFPSLMESGAYATLVIMQPICPWELLMVIKGAFKFAFRRLNKNGAPSHLEGQYFTTYYFTPKDVMNALGKDFTRVDLQGLATFTPPPQFEKAPVKFPRFFKLMTRLDEVFSRVFPFSHWGDHFIITVKYIPSKLEDLFL